jgi:D-cysteine desulfhydrase
MGINIDKNPIFDKPVEEHILEISNRTAFRFNSSCRIKKNDIHIIHDFDHSGYGVLTAAEIQAIRSMSREEGVLLDPVYTGRAFAGLQVLLDRRYFKENATILFWHTGGTIQNRIIAV